MFHHSCAFTGHRKLSHVETKLLSSKLPTLIHLLVENGVTAFFTGGAIGFDTLVAKAVIEKKSEIPNLQLILVLPCQEQTAFWKESDREIYETIKSRADTIVYTSEHYYKGCMQRRNRYLVDHCCFCAYYCTKETGGTFYTICYARKMERKLMDVLAFNLKIAFN